MKPWNWRHWTFCCFSGLNGSNTEHKHYSKSCAKHEQNNHPENEKLLLRSLFSKVTKNTISLGISDFSWQRVTQIKTRFITSFFFFFCFERPRWASVLQLSAGWTVSGVERPRESVGNFHKPSRPLVQHFGDSHKSAGPISVTLCWHCSREATWPTCWRTATVKQVPGSLAIVAFFVWRHRKVFFFVDDSSASQFAVDIVTVETAHFFFFYT